MNDTIPSSPVILEASGVGKRFGSFRALNNASFSIEKGSVFGIIGPNGSGKTTLLKIVTSLISPTSGSVRINGIDVQSDPARALAGTGSIIEWPSFYRDLSARTNLDILSRGHGPTYEKRLAEIAEFTGIASVLKKRVREFSTGMKQRLAITLALLPDSDFIILDEPTNGLDPEGIADIRDLISAQNREFGTTILVTSHLLEEVEKICTHIAVLRQGEVAAFGPMQTLLSRRPVCIVECDRPDEAAAFLARTSLPLNSCTLLPGGCLRVEMNTACTGEVNSVLVGGGFSVRYIEHENNRLEKFFLEIVSHAEGDRK